MYILLVHVVASNMMNTVTTCGPIKTSRPKSSQYRRIIETKIYELPRKINGCIVLCVIITIDYNFSFINTCYIIILKLMILMYLDVYTYII